MDKYKLVFSIKMSEGCFVGRWGAPNSRSLVIELSDVFCDAELEGTCRGPSLLVTKFWIPPPYLSVVGISSILGTWGSVRDAKPQIPSLGLLNQNLHLNKISSWPLGTWKFDRCFCTVSKSHPMCTLLISPFALVTLSHPYFFTIQFNCPWIGITGYVLPFLVEYEFWIKEWQYKNWDIYILNLRQSEYVA